MKRDLTEMNKLEEYLKAHGIEYKRRDTEETPDELDWHQIIVHDQWDAICHYGSYGCEQGLLEIMGALVDIEKDGDSVVGWLTADDVIARIERRHS